MASLSVDGLDDLMLSLEDVAAIPDDVAAAMLEWRRRKLPRG